MSNALMDQFLKALDPNSAKSMVGVVLAVGGATLIIMMAERDLDLCASMWGDCTRALAKMRVENSCAEIWGNDGDFGGEG